MKVIIVTAEWDIHLGLIRHYCSALANNGIDCDLRMINEAKDLLIKYGSRDGIVKIPLIIVVNNAEVKVISIDELRSIIRASSH